MTALLTTRRIVATLALAAVTTAASPVLGQGQAEGAGDELKTCLDAFDRGQTERNAGKLISARKPLETCAAPACPDAVRGKCVGWLGEVEAAIPTVVVSVVAADGSEPTAFRVFIDDKLMAESIDGRAVELEPGSHSVRVEGEGQVLEQSFLAKSGEKNRSVQLKLEAQAPAPAPMGPPVPPGPPPALSTAPPRQEGPSSDEGGGSGLVVVGGVALGLGGAGLVVGAITGAMAMSKSSDLEALCANKECPQGSDGEDELTSAQTVADVSTIMFVAGGVLATVGVTLIIVGSSGDDPESRTGAWIGADVGPGSVGLRGAF